METLESIDRNTALYTPSALINLVNNAININEAKRLIRLKGVYLPGNGQNYRGYYYDTLKDEVSDYQITLIVPGLIRGQLLADKVIEFNGYITRRSNSRGSIEIQINLTELYHQKQSQFTGEEIKALEVQQVKSQQGYRDVEGFMKTRIIRGEKINIVVIVGRTNIIHDDIKSQMKETIGFYDLKFHPVNLSSGSDISFAIRQFNSTDTDIICIARGGGDNLEVFNKAMLAEECLSLTPYFVTAIGHKQDITLVQKMADKSFITPTAFGQFLNDVYNNTKAELEHSRAGLIDDVTKQLKTEYDKQVENLQQQIILLNEINEKSQHEILQNHLQKVAILQKQVTDAQTQYENSKTEQARFYEQQVAALKTNLEKLQQDNQLQIADRQKSFEEKTQLLTRQIAELNSTARDKELQLTTFFNTQQKTLEEQLLQQQRLAEQANEMAVNYKQQYETARNAGANKSGLITAIVISIIAGLLIGYFIFHS